MPKVIVSLTSYSDGSVCYRYRYFRWKQNKSRERGEKIHNNNTTQRRHKIYRRSSTFTIFRLIAAAVAVAADDDAKKESPWQIQITKVAFLRLFLIFFLFSFFFSYSTCKNSSTADWEETTKRTTNSLRARFGYERTTEQKKVPNFVHTNFVT